MSVQDETERRIFPALLNGFERALLNRLSTEEGVSRCEVIRRLLLREAATREVSRREIVLHPSSNGMERFLTAELSGDYAGVVRLAMLNNSGGGHGS